MTTDETNIKEPSQQIGDEMEREFRAAAKWWADLLRQGEVKQDNGDDDPTGQALSNMASRSASKRLTPEAIDKFEESLYENLITSEYSGIRRGMGWGVDYHPCSDLERACQSAGLGDGFMLLPIKTMCFIEIGRVQVRYGYGSPLETIYEAHKALNKEQTL